MNSMFNKVTAIIFADSILPRGIALELRYQPSGPTVCQQVLRLPYAISAYQYFGKGLLHAALSTFVL